MAEPDSTGNGNEGPFLKRKSVQQEENNGGSSRKELKLDSSSASIVDHLGDFIYKGILGNHSVEKRIAVEGSIKGQTAIAILNKKPFNDDTIQRLFTSESKLRHTFQNDIYGSFDCFPNIEESEIKATIVCPATQKHLDKYLQRQPFLVQETKDIYKAVVLPFIESSQFTIQWVFNILEHKKETERIVFEDPNPETGFILLPDLKWDGIALENLYLVAIIHKKGIKSIRDLNETHLPLLENILNSGSKAIEDKYGVKRSQLRIYFHYQPSYYHLHIHFTSLRYNDQGLFSEKVYLQTVIENIQRNSSYYQEATLPFSVKEGDPLYKKLTENGYKF